MIRPLVVVAQSGRALAASAARAGIPVHVLDLYADEDTCSLARSATRIGSIATGVCAERLLECLQAIRVGEGIGGIVAGSGFEDRIDLLEAMTQIGPLFGNAPEIVRRAKDPACFFPLLARLGIPHPETLSAVPAGVREDSGWLCKQIGGAGGGHVRLAGAGCPSGHYLQRQAPGRPHSVVFLADGRRAAIIGYNEIHIRGGTDSARFRCMGAVTVPDPENAPAIEEAVQALVPALGLRGLCGLDFMQDEDGRYAVLEVNPRPIGTFELYEDLDDGGASFLERHLAACEDRLSLQARSRIGAIAAHEILFATGTVAIPRGLEWPDWARDRPASGTRFQAGEPICTLHAQAPERMAVERLLSKRRAILTTALGWPQAA